MSVDFTRIEDLDDALDPEHFRRDDFPWTAGSLAVKAFLAYRKRGGARGAPLPGFFVGAHAAVTGLALLTRDGARYRTYFQTGRLVAP